MTNQHTPGPWNDKATGKWCEAIPIVGRDNVEVARVATDGQRNDSAKNKANARLIAASPSLLEALQEWMPLIEDKYGWNTELNAKVERARAAIARATGAKP